MLVTPSVSALPARSARIAMGPIAIAMLVVFTFLICYFRSFIFPNVPIVLWGDQLGFFYDGGRIVDGQLPYRDYFQIVSPGTDLTYAFLIKCFGLRAWIPNLVMVFLASTMTWLMILIARRLMAGAISLLPALVFVGFILYGSLDPTHHWFSTIVVMGAMLVLLDDTSLPRVAAAGALCGLAACFTQTKGATAVAGFIGYLVWTTRPDRNQVKERLRKCLLLCGAAAGVFFAANAYFIAAAGFKRWLYCMIVYPLLYYPAPTVNHWRVVLYDFQWHGGTGKWISYPFVYVAVPLVYVVFFLTMRRKLKKEPSVPWDQLLLVALTGLGMLLAGASAPSMKRLCTVSAPAMILLAWLVNRIGKDKTRVCATVILGTAAVAFAIETAIHAQLRWSGCLNLPAGRMAFPDPILYEEYSWVLAHSSPGQFFYGMPPLYTPFHLRNPAATDVVESTEYTRPEQVAAVIQALDSHAVPLLILRQSADLLRPTYSPSDHLAPFRAYLLKNYHLTQTFPDGDDVWQKN
jgi:hypothetical protein